MVQKDCVPIARSRRPDVAGRFVQTTSRLILLANKRIGDTATTGAKKTEKYGRGKMWTSRSVRRSRKKSFSTG